MTFWQKMFSFEGRMARQDFWICTLILWAIHIVILVAFCVVAFAPLIGMGMAAEKSGGEIDDAAAMTAMMTMLPAFALYGLFRLAMVWPSTAVNVKRFHDRNQTGWLSLIFVGCTVLSFIPIVGLIFSLGSFIFWLVDLGIIEGTLGPNAYGESPNPLYNAASAFA